jgi:hypothetical protein
VTRAEREKLVQLIIESRTTARIMAYEPTSSNTTADNIALHAILEYIGTLVRESNK